MDAQSFLQTVLPAGEWSNINVVSADGLMSGRDWAILATADWQRRGEVAAFIKFIRAAGPTAGKDTHIVTNAERLRQIEARLQKVRQSRNIPVVPILEIRMILDKGLLLAMERVQIVQTLIDSGKAGRDLATKLLIQLNPDKIQSPQIWHHFDVCARNIGITRDGRPVFIDIESIYFETDGNIAVTVPVFKPWRLPQALKNEVLGGTRAEGIIIQMSAQLANQKLKSEIILAAAECCLGAIPHPIDPLDWLASFSGNKQALTFLEALSLLSKGKEVDLDGLAAMIQAIVPSADPIRAPSHPVDPSPPNPTSDAAPISSTPSPAASDWEALHETLTGQARALRRAELTKDEITKYREQLEQITAQFPEALPVWNELLLVAISYELDRDRAFLVVNRALDIHGDDKGLKQWKQILSTWKAT
ncbi:hypothetical protein [Corallococcus sicarius]|uniref:hypothetical protein n=1 Tax=Corallococcus sicarius TaxID=2316726 RepID=UPI0011C3F647|nr:hypothetical protein [Corallococcus sicarius]